MKEKITPAGLGALAMGDMENLIAASTPAGMEAQEAAGQKEFVANQTLPIDGPRRELELLGFQFGERESDDDIFIPVQFPEGWSKKPTEHSMWSHLLDDKDRVRGSIFYKAAFYDRNAHMRLERRYSCQRHYELKENEIQYLIKDGDKTIFETEIVQVAEGQKFYDIADVVEATAVKWLEDNYPDYNDVKAYWD